MDTKKVQDTGGSQGKRGFTLIELLVVIAIISIISSIAFANLRSAREKATAINIVSNLKQVEKAFYFLADHEGISTWWPEGDFGFGSNPDISGLVTDTNRLGKFLQRAPDLSVGTNMGFDNDSDVFVCGGGDPVYYGVNIHIRNIPLEMTQRVSTIVDKNTDVNCGRVKWDPSVGGSLFYVISETHLKY